MQALIRFFVELCLLRRAPQDLPAADILFWIGLAANLVVGVPVGLAFGLGFGSSLAQGIAELAFQLGLLFAALKIAGHLGRFTQSATALLGSGAVLGLLAWGPIVLSRADGVESDAAALNAFMLFALYVWNLVVIGHILRHTFGVTLAQGVVVALLVMELIAAMVGAG
ncbi:hypothetical protein [uncultured Thiodictyon sp.]|uniref:hypothetical protein n=1 Tax=uncultured Thiodictyon sp. TaxID=1846217 RepID=UPI0025D49491|nr:hypothetical protein [uncultured Thiodictyon sp.]